MAYATLPARGAVAYPCFALGSWLIVRGRAGDAATPRRSASSPARVAPFGRRKSRRSPPRSSSPAAGLWGRPATRQALRANWSRGDTLGAIVLLIGALFLFNRRS